MPRVDVAPFVTLASASLRDAYAPIHNVIKGISALLKKSPRQITLADRIASVNTIEINPSRFVAYVGDRQAFRAIGKDFTGSVVQGVKFTWSTPDPSSITIDEAGRAAFLKPGLARITCAAGSSTATALVLVRSGSRGVESDSAWRDDQGDPAVGTASPPSDGGASGKAATLLSQVISPFASVFGKLVPTVHAQNGGGGSGSAWTTSNFIIGTPRNGVIEPTRFGAVLPETYNFELAIPVVASLGNRRLNVPLTLYYNSRIWAVTGPSTMQFDPNQSWPCPGFSMGFGRIDTVLLQDGVTAQYTLVDPNGTTHYLGSGPASVTGAPPPYPTYTTSDGTYISYIGDAVHGGELYYPSGVKYDISLVNNRLLPSQITEPNGNYVQIAYKHTSYDQNGNPIGPVYSPFALDYVVDTMGRNITTAYDTSSGTGLLTSIVGPSGGASFSYQQKSLSYNFSNTFGPMTVQGAPSSYFALTTINAQQNYQMTYSDYGMVYSFTMGGTATVTFDYPTSGTTQLAGAPAFTQRTETSGTVSGTYSYSINNTVTTITRPDTSTMILTDNGTGLLAQSEIKLGATSYAKMVYTYANDPGGAKQVTSVQAYDDTGTPRRVDYGYDSHGNVTSKLEYGFQVNGVWQVQRKTVITYQGSPYTDNHMLNLVTGVSLYDGNNNQVAGTSYAYDGYGGTLLQESNNVPGHLSSYDYTYTLRGNPTTVSRLTDVATGASTSRSAQYDIFGNAVEVQLSCCNQKTFTYGADTYYSQPDQTTSGGAGTSLTNSASYNFNTSAMTSKTDPNGLTTNYVYNSWLQPTQIQPPSGASMSLGYDNWGSLDSESFSYSDGGVNKAFSFSATHDGWGNPVKQFDASNNEIDLAYDNMGRLISRTNPFAHGGTPGPATTYQYDTLGRAVLVTLPDGNTTQTIYNGSSVKTVDEVGRKMRYKRGGLGRLIEVDEPDPATGLLTQITTYTYDLLDNLTGVNQSGQIRSFKRDAAGRLIYERIPEQTATIDDSTGTLWTCKYTYTDFDAVATKTDARGVVITRTYDTMNRLVGVSYNTSNAPGVAATPNVTYSYDNSSTSTTKGLLLSVSVGTFYSESYSYDGLNRPASLTDTINGKVYTTRYQYNQVNQVTQLTYPSGRVLPYTFDATGHLSSVGGTPSNPTGYLGAIGYNNADQVSGYTLGNGINESFTYDPNRMQLTGISASKGNSSLMNLAYSYTAQAGQLGTGTTPGNADQLVAVSGTVGGQAESASYSYDLNHRLVATAQTSNGQTAGRAFTWDRWTNRLSETDTIANSQIQSVTLQQSGGAPTNQISSVNNGGTVFTYQYDNSGNVINDGANTYTYDAENRLVTASASTSAQYSYDFQSRRIIKAVGASITHYVWRAHQVLAEHDGATGNNIVDYILHGNAFAAKILSDGTVNYFVRDRMSERLRTDASGNIVGQMGHLPFGEDFGESGVQERHHLAGYERDPETGLDYAMNRVYSPATGRFLSVDPGPSHVPMSSAYAYAAGDPVGNADPDGRDLMIIGGALYELSCMGKVDTSGSFEDGGVSTFIDSNKENCTLINLGSVFQNPSGRPTGTIVPCNVTLPTDSTKLDELAVIMHESTSADRVGQNSYATGDRAGHPTGPPITGDDLQLEESDIAEVISNVASANHESLEDAMSQLAHDPNHSYDRTLRQGGQDIVNAMKDNSSTSCDKLKRAMNAVNGTVQGDLPSDFDQWRGVRQGHSVRHLNPGDIRHGDTDFFAQ